MEHRDRAILEPINLEYCNPGSEIYSDEWGAYCHLDTLGYVQRQVNCQHNYVNPVYGAHKHGIGLSLLGI